MIYSSNRNARAKEAYKKFVRRRGVFGIAFNNKDLKQFREVQSENKAFNNSFIGIKNIALDKIVGSVDKYRDFDDNFIPKNSIIEERWCRIYLEVMGDANLPPVNLYKIRDEYYVYDGNHRISVANFMNFKMIEAEVTEFFPSGETEEDVIIKERFAFEKELGLEGIVVTKTGGYRKLRRSIEDYQKDVKLCDRDLLEATKEWYEKLYKPIRRILINNNVIKIADGDSFLAYLDHKYYLSEYRKHNVGYAYSLIDFINYMNVINGERGTNIFKLDRNFTSSFRDLYNVDKTVFYKTEFSYKLKKITDFSERKFVRRNHILGEIALYSKQNNIEDFEEAMKKWFTEVYAEYYEMFLDKSAVLGNKSIFTEDQMVVEDIIRFAREYRRKNNRLLTKSEIVLTYVLDIYLPIVNKLGDELEKSEEGAEKKYIDISHRYMYYLRYGGNKNLIKFEEDYLVEENSSSFLETIGLRNSKADMFRDIKKLIIYYAPTKSQGEKSVNEFYKIVNKYGGTHNFSTIKNLKESLISTSEVNPKVDWVTEVFSKELEELSLTDEVFINYNTKRVIQLVKGIWSNYSIIDYYASIIPLSLRKKDSTIIEAAHEYMKSDFRY